MDYEKIHNLSLELGRKLIEKNPELREWVESKLPELRESEDERIRKALVKEFEDKVQRGYEWKDGIPNNSVLAWLEKKKESSHKDTCSFVDDTILGKLISAFKSIGSKTWGGMEVTRIIAYLEKQKPNIEICPHCIKSKSYKENGCPIEDCDYGLEIALGILEKTIGKVQGFQTDDGVREHQTAIKAVKDVMKEPKPSEWSEEDKKMLKCCLIAINHYEKTCNIGDHLPTKFNIDGYLASVDKVKSWLKSLRPSWKPSEEQMRILNWAANGMVDNSIAAPEMRAVLRELYEQLKKL